MLLKIYRSLLILYPAEFRDEYGREMCLALADRVRERTSLARTLVWLHAALGVLSEAPKEHYHIMMQDLRHALRVMRNDAGITAGAIAILALGIGSTTTVFSLVNGILVRPLPFPEPNRLVAVEEYHPAKSEAGSHGAVAFPNYLDLRVRTRLLDDLGLFTEDLVTIRGEGEAESVPGAAISDGVFRVLGVKPVLGRVFTREEDAPNGPNIAVLSQELWQRRYGGDPGLIGKNVDIGGVRRTIIGVMPASFHFPERAEIWQPLQLSPKEFKRTDHWLQGVARLRPGVSVEQASDELRALMRQINAENPVTSYGNLARAVPIRKVVAGEYRTAAVTLLGAAGFLLLIACGNITNLLLVKASVRAREMAVRKALGATRPRLVRQLITESALFGILGGMGGVALAYASVPALLSLIPVELPRWMVLSIDARVLGFAVVISLLTSLIFGLAPAFGASKIDLTSALKEGGRAASAGLRRQLLRHALVVGEVALSLTLLAGAGLMIRSFLALRHQAVGFRPEKVLTFSLAWPGNRYPRGDKSRALVAQIRSELASLPGASSVAFASGVPLADRWGRTLTVEGYPVLALEDAPMINHTVATPGYFEALGIPLIEGRDFTDADWDNPRVAIVDRALAARYWPNQSPLGKRIRFGPPESNEPWHTVIGVAGAVRNQSLNGRNRWNIYIPINPFMGAPSSVLLRTAQDPLRLAQAAKSRIVALDRDIAVSRILSLEQVVDRAAWRERFFAVLFAVFSGLALVLAAAGVYGVLAYAVSLRRHEIGIRMALGASARQVQSLVMREGLMLTGLGLVCGTAAALGLTRLLATQLFHISPTDPPTFFTVIAVLLVVAAIAAFVPARRATRVDPAIALRDE